jgi:arylformamidase
MRTAMPSPIWLSYEQSASSPRPASIPASRIERIFDLDSDGSNVFGAYVTSHSGTHVDAPRHMIRNGYSIMDFRPSEFMYKRCICLEIELDSDSLVQPEQLRSMEGVQDACDLLLVRSGWWRFRGTDDRYVASHPGFSEAAAHYLLDQWPHLRALGVDFLSLAAAHHLEEGIEAHKILLGGVGRRFLIYEDMDLSRAGADIRQVHAMPWRIDGMDSAPCTIVGFTGLCDAS